MLLLAVILAAPPAEFAVAGADSPRTTGLLRKFDADGTAELEADGRVISVKDVVSIRRTGVAIPASPRGPVLITSTTDRIRLQKTDGKVILGGSDQSLRVRPSFIDADWDVPVAFASLLWLEKPPADTPFDPARYSWLPANRNRDILRLRNGDLASGTLAAFTDDGDIKLKPESGDERLVASASLSAIAFNPTLSRGRRVKGPYARVVLGDGTRLGLVQASSDGITLKGKTLFGQAVEIAIGDVSSLDVIQGKATFLADLMPKKVEQTAFLRTTWNWQPNRTVRGEPLRIGDSTFDRGLGTHPRTVLTYDLGGKYRRFDAVIGADRAVVKVLVDGKEQPLPDLLNVSVNLAGAKELTLVTDFGPTGDVQADVNWGDARLVE
jgi:hypothetical protein